MSARCPKCGKPKSTTVVCCPHCGAADASIDPRDPALAKEDAPSDRVLSMADAAVLLETKADERGFFSDFFLPSPNLHGWRVVLDLLLIVLSLPLFAGALFAIVGRRTFHRKVTTTGHYVENIAIAFLGGAMLVAVAYRYHAHYSALWTAGFAALALIGRVALRARGMPDGA